MSSVDPTPSAARRSLFRLGVLFALAYCVAVIPSCFDPDVGPASDNDESLTPPDDDRDAIDPDDCLACHVTQARRWMNPSSHKSLYDCTYCHAKITSAPAKGHRVRPWCISCHSESTHVPTWFGDDNFQLMNCRSCHNPHGSTNAFLILENMVVGEADQKVVVFNNLDGLAEGSYALPGDMAGRGLCEVCHVATEHYNRFGTGTPHFTTRCSECHTHESGFGLPTP